MHIIGGRGVFSSSFSFFEDNGGELVGLKQTEIVSNIQMNKGF